MKKGGFFAAVLCLCLTAFVLFTGCAAEQPANSGEAGGGTPGGATEATWAFVSGGVELPVDADMKELEEKLGEPVSYFEEPSCAAEGISRIFTYPGFVITTYPDGNRDLIGYIDLKDDSVATPEGVDLSMNRDDVIRVYGSEFEENDTSLSYKKGSSKLIFILDGDYIASIEYASSVLN